MLETTLADVVVAYHRILNANPPHPRRHPRRSGSDPRD